MANPVTELVREYATHIRQSVPALAQVLEEWPVANQQLAYPSLTIFQGSPEFENLAPYELSRSEVESGLIKSLVVVGQYDLRLQLDLWCRNKKERDDVFESLFNALNPEVLEGRPMGKSLKLTNYYGIYARTEVIGHTFGDLEEGAQRQEWRVKLTVLGHVKAVREITNFAILTIENQLSTPDNIPSS